MRKLIFSFCLMIASTVFAHDPVTGFLPDQSFQGTNRTPSGPVRLKSLHIMSKGKLDLIYLNEKFYFYPKLQFMRLNFLRPHQNKELYLMSLQLSTSILRGLGGDAEGVLLPYQMIAPHCGLLDMEASFRTTFYNAHESVGYVGMHARAALRFNSFNQHITNDNTIEKRIFPSFFAELSFFGQTDLGMGDVESSNIKGHKRYHLVGFMVIGGLFATASREHILEAFDVHDSNTAFGIFGELGIVIGQKHEFRVKVTKMLDKSNFISRAHGYGDMIYRLSLNMRL